MKICIKCKIEKEDSEFYKTSSYCINCFNDYNKSEKRLKYRKEYQKEYHKKRKKIDPKYKLDCNVSSYISTSLKGLKAGKTWQIITGYSINDLYAHLEKQFDDKMTWNNYGSYWHIDHIKPRSLFNYTYPEDKEFKECWSLSNLQPLEAIENIKKSNHY